jgi:hypothetical protein
MLTVRGHRLVFSNGIMVLAAASIVLLLATGARVASLIPMYAIGVFTGFTMAAAGMVKHHLTHREGHWRKRVGVNGIAAVVCAVVVVVFAVAEFTQGAWAVVVVMPILVYGLVRTNRQYRAEDVVLEEGAAVEACEVRVLRHHVVVVLIDRIDLATARAIQYARTLMPDEIRAIHFNIDNVRSDRLIERWQQVGLSRLPLDVIDCPDRRLGRAALELAADLADGETEVSMLLPRRSYGRTWSRILHDKTADHIIEIVSQLSHVNATIVPFSVAPGIEGHRGPVTGALVAPHQNAMTESRAHAPQVGVRELPKTTRIADLEWRKRARVAGRVKSLRLQPRSEVPTLECVLVDESGATITLVFLGRRSIAGLRSGAYLAADGMVGKYQGKVAMINPLYELLAVQSDTKTRARNATKRRQRQ